MCPYLSLDFESTGLCTNTDRIVQIGLTLTNGETHRVIERIVNPGYPCTEAARAIHRISDEELARASDFPMVWSVIVSELAGWDLPADVPVCAWNGWSFDFPLLSAELARYGFPLPLWRPCDPKLALRPPPGESRSLEATCARYGVPLERPDGRHGAGADSLALALLAECVSHVGDMPHPAELAERQGLRW